jgi:hypothetical protein
MCDARRGHSVPPFGWTSARPIFWQLLVKNVYHQCVIEKRFRTEIAQVAMRISRGIRQVYQENLRSRNAGEMLKATRIML